MSLVAVWSPLNGGTGSTMLAAALPIVLAMEYQTRVLLTHGGHAGERVELAFSDRKEMMDNALSFHDNGMDALERLSTSGRLNPENVRNYSVPLIAGRLDLLGGSRVLRTDLSANEQGATLMSRVLEASRHSHDVTVADAGNGAPGAADRAILNAADLVVIGMNQNLHLLETVLSKGGLPDEVKEKPCFYSIGRYDRECSATLQNIKRRFGLKGYAAGVPYCSGMTDAWNTRNVLMYMQRSRGEYGRKRWNSLYLAMQGLAQGIAEECGLPAVPAKARAMHALG
ncbi:MULTISPECIES: P-loop NTPase family protein [Paenibacillus]|uniref:hypothetical protein n=1 Tax=Paenibacillus TaxID=44249 RepID=UPI00048C197E|nr:hypothetical protein [Paenibacillus sp. IHBB 10380]